MARFEPALESIKQMTYDKPTCGEQKLLDMLEGLDNSFEIFFQPHINIAHPDIVILRKNCGCLIIEVKDWNLSSYQRTGSDKLKGKNADYYVASPFEQVQNYKSALFNRFSPSMHIGLMKNEHVFGVVVAGVFFSNATDQQVTELFGEQAVIANGEKKYKRFHPFWTMQDSAGSIVERINSILTFSSSTP